MDFSTGQRNRLDTVFKRCYNWKIADRKDQNIETNALPIGSEEVYTPKHTTTAEEFRTRIGA